MADDRGVVRAFAWRDLFPWLLLARVFRLAIGMQLLFFASLGVLLQPLGWRLSEALFLGEADRPQVGTLAKVIATERYWPGQEAGAQTADLPLSLTDVLRAYDGISATYHGFTDPVILLFDPRLNLNQFAYLVVGNLYSLLVWALLGGVLARIAVVRLAREERVSTRRAVVHAARRYLSYFFAPLAMLVLVGLSGLFPAFLGLFMRWDLAAPLAGFCWPVALLCGLVMAICLVALLFGWPLMWGAIAAENSDYLDALSRSFAYTLQKPLNYLFYACVAAFLGGLGWIVVFWFSEAVVALTLWSASWGMGHERFQELGSASNPEGALAVGLTFVHWSSALVRCIAASYRYSYFWCSAAGIYLLLRHDVDQKEIDEVYLEDEEDAYSLPPLPTDAAGVPGAPEVSPTAFTPPAEPAPAEQGGSSNVSPQPE